MRSELLIAILLGLGLGLLIAGGVYRSRRAPTPTAVTSPTPSPIDEALSRISISNPQPNAIVESAELTVAGVTEPSSFVALAVNEIPYFTSSDAAGAFAKTVQLTDRATVITVLVTTEEGERISSRVPIVYLNKKLDELLQTPSPSPTPTDSKDGERKEGAQ